VHHPSLTSSWKSSQKHEKERGGEREGEEQEQKRERGTNRMWAWKRKRRRERRERVSVHDRHPVDAVCQMKRKRMEMTTKSETSASYHQIGRWEGER
jgi:hypothetical protein